MVTAIKTEEKTVLCIHQEVIDERGRAICLICGQIKYYYADYTVTIAKRGGINGVITRVVPPNLLRKGSTHHEAEHVRWTQRLV